MQVRPVTEIDIRFVPGPWAVSAEFRAAAAVHWQQALARNPHLWDGRILGFTTPEGSMPAMADGVFRAEAHEDAFSTFLYWRDQGFPDIGHVHAFGTALIVSSDRALILGVMGGQTANAGGIYPPGGSLEPRDVRADGRIDVSGCIRTELEEETGLRADDARTGGLFAIVDGPRLSFGQVFHFAEPVEALLARIRANIRLMDEQELADVVAVRTRAEAKVLNTLPYAVAAAEALEQGVFV